MRPRCDFSTVVTHTIATGFLPPNAVVVDLGANVGDFSRIMARDYRCSCFAIEPSPEVFEQIPSGDGVRKYNLAIAGTAGVVALNISSNSEATSMHRVNNATYSNVAIQVPAQTLEEFCRLEQISRIDLLKIDIEGEELAVLASCSDAFLKAIDQVSVEFHEWVGVGSEADVRRVIERFKRLGFFAFSFSRTQYLDVLFINDRKVSYQTYVSAWLRIWVPRFFRSIVRKVTSVSPGGQQ
jgi:FkbM family methyltransferase